ncbi:MAG: hypothetical protein CVV28_09960 [Methanobacteriales archaeon HGW-Methanobacteriales-1]|jgi:hypothetical protein|nr:MAG: hypothetical protein CVV28_09960 [Methanobacteriales archaeon HGW-Methanobacteriales-1]
MSDKIYLIKDDNPITLEEKEYKQEIVLQELLGKYPDILAGEQMNPENPRRWILVTSELHLVSKDAGNTNFYLDHLFLDQDGIPTLVEDKIISNHQIRREVIGQMFDYAANAVAYLPMNEIRSLVELHNDVDLMDFLQPGTNSIQFWQNVKTNLKIGKIRMVFAADKIPNELKRIIEFLNHQMDPAEVFGLEIKQYVNDEEKIKTMVPRIIGPGIYPDDIEPLLNKDTFFDLIDENGKLIFSELFKLALENHMVMKWGTKGFSLNVEIGGKTVSLLQGYSALAKYDQCILSTNSHIINKVNDGDKIVEDYLKITELKNFDKNKYDFIYKINQKIGQNDLEEFKSILSKTISSIKENGLSN